jgi:hypothetical protein
MPGKRWASARRRLAREWLTLLACGALAALYTLTEVVGRWEHRRLLGEIYSAGLLDELDAEVARRSGTEPPRRSLEPSPGGRYRDALIADAIASRPILGDVPAAELFAFLTPGLYLFFALLRSTAWAIRVAREASPA